MTEVGRILTHGRLGICAILVGLRSLTLGTQHPRIQAVSPTSGITTPGIRVTVVGTNFSPDAAIYFDGLQSRETKFISSTELDVETPYLRPGTHMLQISSGAASSLSEVQFTSLPSKIDSQIDKAIEIAGQGKIDEAASLLEQIGTTDSDYQVRAAAYYVEAQIFFNRGDFAQWRRASALIYLDPEKSGKAVQAFWPYRLAIAWSHY